ncbi:MAG TPA: spherulation-specific family 4 protein [Solirubrobacteraceae bacterium]|nr:spherulation-specific family 4 protein [Solirubrobacteraceae bacterium]
MRLRGYVLPVAAAALLCAGAVPAGARLLVPAYFGPEGTPSPWRTMCSPADAGSIAIVNPHNGPVKKQGPLYAPAIARCREQGWRVAGYVFTRYGRRNLAAVEKAISRYRLSYPGVEGIFLDEMAEADTAKNEAYYGSLRDYVREEGGFVVGNPGDTAATGWQLPYVDLLVTFEGPASQYASYTPAPWVGAAGQERIANIVFAASGSGAAAGACSQASAQGAGYRYVTDLPEAPNPYAQLPSYWQPETEVC